MRTHLVAAVLLAVGLAGDHDVHALGACPPERDRRNPDLQRVKDEKKAELLARGYPERFMTLIDQEPCLECVRTASAYTAIERRAADGDYQIAAAVKKNQEVEAVLRRTAASVADLDSRIAAASADASAREQSLTACATPCATRTANSAPGNGSSSGIASETSNPPQAVVALRTQAQAVGAPAAQGDSVCPRCRALAAAVAAFEAELRGLVDQRDASDVQLSLMRFELGAVERELDQINRQPFASLPLAERDQLGERHSQLTGRRRSLEDSIEELEGGRPAQDANVAAIQSELQSLRNKLTVCLQSCTARQEPSSSFDAPGAACAECQLIAEAFSAADSAVRAHEQERSASVRLRQAHIERGSELRSQREAANTAGNDVAARIADERSEEAYRQAGIEDENILRLSQQLIFERRIRQILQEQLDACNRRCALPATTSTPAPDRSMEIVDASPACFGDSCSTEWAACTTSDTCRPAAEDCGNPGACSDDFAATDGGPPLVDLGSDGAWTTSASARVELRVQVKLVDLRDPAEFPQLATPAAPAGGNSGRAPSRFVWLTIQPAPKEEVRSWFNPLGLIVRSVAEHLQRWRASMGPRPLLRKDDLDLIDRVTNVQATGLPKGVHVLVTDRGGSTGKTLVMKVLNLTGQPIRLSSRPFAVQPIQPQAQQQIAQAFNRLAKAAPVQLDLSAYCLELLKAPPAAGTILRVAPADVQQQFAPAARLLQSAYRVSKANAFRPDSAPAAYVDAIKQWSIWTVDRKFNQQRFTEAFLDHTKKNVESAGQKWSAQAADLIRKASPNRWNDIVKVLRGAGMPVPQ